MLRHTAVISTGNGVSFSIPSGSAKSIAITASGQKIPQKFRWRMLLTIMGISSSEMTTLSALTPPSRPSLLSITAAPASMKNTDLLDVKMNILDSSMRVLTNHTRLHLFTGTSEILCRAVLLDKEEIGPGESGYVQLRLEDEIAVRRGDKFVVRFYSPMETIGGGVILEPNPGVKRRFQQDVIEELKRKESGSSADVIELHIKEHGDTMITSAELAKLTALSMDEVNQDIEELKENGQIYVFPMKKDTFTWHADSKRGAVQAIVKNLESYEKENPYRYGMKKAEVQMTHFKGMKPNVFDKVIELLETEGYVKRVGEFLCTPQFEIKKDETYNKIAKTVLGTFESAKYDFAKYSEIDFGKTPRATADDILNVLLVEGKVVKIAEDMYTLTEYMEEAKNIIREKLAEDPVITIAQVRDIFATSRKSAKPILEYMDSIKVTKKVGAESERVAY